MSRKVQSEPLLLIGALSNRTSVNIETIRYYERIGLLASPDRTEGGHRLYATEHVQALSFIRRGRELGFSINDIRALLELSTTRELACETAREITLKHLVDIRAKVVSLRKLERVLNTMTAGCNPGVQSSCPIIDALGGASL